MKCLLILKIISRKDAKFRKGAKKFFAPLNFIFAVFA